MGFLGIGLSAKAVERGGCDLILVYNSGRFRMAGRGSLAGLMPYSDANQVVVEMVSLQIQMTFSSGRSGLSCRGLTLGQAAEVLPVVKDTPVLAGVCGTDPFREMHSFLSELKRIGFVGVQNFPTVGLIDGQFRQNLEETEMGYDREVEMIKIAHELGLVTTPYVFSADDATAMAKAGADIVVAHAGLTTSGDIGARTGRSLEDCVGFVQEIRDAAHQINPEILVLCHGGPIARPADAEYVLSRTKGVHGFFGASSMERLPVEVAIKENAAEFKRLKVRLE